MRPLKLVISAFGPYAGEETVDFRELGDKRFFVITGPTGAGKTSVLDAMTFALYGDTATGKERTGKDMRSLFAAANVMSEVTLDFSVGAEFYRVWRRPEQERPKLRGGGTTTEKADAGLWRRTGLMSDAEEGEALAAGVRDVDKRVSELLGFDCDQFRQVVVLPQGRFREVLSAEVKTREEILRQLFKTDRFARLTDHFKAARNESRRAIEGLTERRRGVLENAGVDSREQLDELVEEARGAETAARETAMAAAAVAETARAALERGREARAILDELRDSVAALESLEIRADEFAEKRDAAHSARRALVVQPAFEARERAAMSLKQAEASRDAAIRELPGLEESHTMTCESLEQARQAQTEIEALETLGRQVVEAQRLADDVDHLAKLRREMTDRSDVLSAAREAARRSAIVAAEAATECADIELGWLASRAGSLGIGLVSGTPCPVCGSTDHPAPAAAHNAVADSVLEAAREDAHVAATGAAVARERVNAAEKSLEEATARAEEAAKRLGEAGTVDAVAARQRLSELKAVLERRQGAAQKARHDLDACEEARTQAAARLEGVRARVVTFTEQVEQWSREVDSTSLVLSEALTRAQFDDLDSFLAVRKLAAELDALEGAVRRYEDAQVAARERVARARAAAELTGSEPDIAALEAADQEARRAADAARDACVIASERLGKHLDAIKTIDRFEAEAKDLLNRHTLVARIADVAEGSNELKLSFQRYVLGAYLDEVLNHANHRLQRMTGGRYRLERSTTVGHRGRPSGLSLAVFDEQAGESRPAGTLSGGEGFLASLALALGLAEAVQAHAGGVKLETIFIDEGFGTLDPEALEMAIGTLLDLAGVAAEQGRLVGIISHVPELKERIDARLEVMPGEKGSSARFVV